MSILEDLDEYSLIVPPLKQSIANALDSTKRLRERLGLESERRGIPWAAVVQYAQQQTGKSTNASMQGLRIGELRRVLAGMLAGGLDTQSRRYREPGQSMKATSAGVAKAESTAATGTTGTGAKIRPRPRRKWA